MPFTPGENSIDKSLRLKLQIYLGILAIALAFLVADVVRVGTDSVVPVVLGLGGGLVLGILASRMSALSWDVANAKVVGRIDALGAVILVGYIFLVIFRGSVIAQLVDPRVVGAASVSTLSGLMLGQALGTIGGISRVVRLARGRKAVRAPD